MTFDLWASGFTDLLGGLDFNLGFTTTEKPFIPLRARFRGSVYTQCSMLGLNICWTRLTLASPLELAEILIEVKQLCINPMGFGISDVNVQTDTYAIPGLYSHTIGTGIEHEEENYELRISAQEEILRKKKFQVR